jgi:hypothetical protein
LITRQPVKGYEVVDGVVTAQIFSDDLDHLLSALNCERIKSIFWNDEDGEVVAFVRQLTTLARDLKALAQKLSTTRDVHGEREIIKETDRLRQQIEWPRYQRLFYPDFKRRRLRSMIVPVGDGDSIKDKQQRAINALGDLLTQGTLGHLRECGHCRCWFLAARVDQKFCSDNCRQQHFQKEKKKNKDRRAIRKKG